MFIRDIDMFAGACNGLSYISRQRGRAKYSNIDLLDKYNYIGLRHLLRKRNIMDLYSIRKCLILKLNSFRSIS